MPELLSLTVPHGGPALRATWVRIRIECVVAVQWIAGVVRMYVRPGRMRSCLVTLVMRVHFPLISPWRTTLAVSVRRTGLQNRPNA